MSLRTSYVMGGLLAGLVVTATGCSQGDAGASEDGTPRGETTMVVPVGAGGGSDRFGRFVAAGLEEVAPDLSMHVENRDGGSGAVGYSFILGEEGNGNYLLTTETDLVALPLSGKVEFDHSDFTPIMKFAEDFTLLVVKADSPYRTCTDIVEKAKTDRVVVGVAGEASLDNIVFRLIEQAMGMEFDRVPFESGGELVAAVLGEQIEVASLNPGEAIGQIESGDLRALCAAADQRYEFEALKDIPTAKEQGIDVAFAQFRGIVAPPGITDAQRDFWIDAIEKLVETDAYDAYIEENFLQATPTPGDEFGDYLDENSQLIKQALDL